MEETRKERRFHFNWVDVIIILLVIAVLGVVVFLRNRSAGVTATTPISYEVEFKQVPRAVADVLQEGTAVFEATDSTPLGTVAEVTAKPHTEYWYSESLGAFGEVEGTSFDVYVKVNADATVTAQSTSVSGNPVGVGNEISMKAQGMGATGYVVALTLDENAVPKDAAQSGDHKIAYQMRVENVREMTTKQFHVGDFLFSEDDNACLGRITSVEVQEHQESKLGGNGEGILLSVPEKYSVLLGIEGMATEKEYGYYLDGATELKVGADISACNAYLCTTLDYFAIDQID